MANGVNLHMFKKANLALVILASTISMGAMAATKTYQMDPTHTSVVVSWNHFGFSNPTADFSNVTGTINFDDKAPAKSSVDVTIPVKTVDTHVPALTAEFLEADYFDVSKFPTATFKSTKVEAKGGKKYDVYGKLTIKGHSKNVVLHATLNKEGIHPMAKVPAIGFDATTTIKRSEFGLAKYVPYVSDAITIRISTEAEAAK